MSARSRELLSRYRAATSLTPADRTRVLRRLQARVAAGDVPPASVDAPAPPLPSSARLVPARFWIIAAAAGALGLGSGVWLLAAGELGQRQSSPASPAGPDLPPALELPAKPPPTAASMPPGEPPERALPARLEQPRLEPRPLRRRQPDKTAAASGKQPAPVLEETPRVLEQSAPESASVPVVALPERPEPPPSTPSVLPERTPSLPAAETLAEEMQVLEDAQAALRRGDSHRALALLAEHAWRFPDGRLAEARDVARILALCQAGQRDGSRSLARRFLAEHPQSPFAARVRASCP
jgi:hypothetical protein